MGIQVNESVSLFRVHIKKSTKLAPIQTLISAMFIKSSLCFTLIAVIIAGNGMARYLLVDVANEKGISDKRDDLPRQLPGEFGCELGNCGCNHQGKPGCPGGMVCCHCTRCKWFKSCNRCQKSCEKNLNHDLEVPAICSQNITNLTNA